MILRFLNHILYSPPKPLLSQTPSLAPTNMHVYTCMHMCGYKHAYTLTQYREHNHSPQHWANMKRAGGYGHSGAFNHEGSRVPSLSRRNSARVSFNNKLISIKDSASYINQMPSVYPI